MPDDSRVFEAIGRSEDPKQLRQWIDNANRKGRSDIADVAFRRLISILPAERPGTVEYDFWKTIHAFEQILSGERDRTTRLARTRQKVARVGEMKTLEDWALGDKRTDGFDMLLERGMPELTGEAIVLRHADRFPPDVVAAARRRLEEAGVDLARLPAA